MVAGTSTGGIIALGLGIGFSAEQICEFYHKDGRTIFPQLPTNFFESALRFVRHLRRPVLSYVELENALKRRFGNRCLGESNVRLVVPAFMADPLDVAVFKTDHHADFRSDHATPMWKIARATSAAPTYFRGLEDKPSGQVFLDGGVWANNPTMVALVDVLSCYDIEPDQIQVLSIGTGSPPFRIERRRIFGGLYSWKNIIKAAMYLTTSNATSQANLILGPSRHIRLEPTGKAASVGIDDYDMAFDLLPEAAQNTVDIHKQTIERILNQRAQPRERHYS